LISVLVDTYNHDRFLSEALDSVLGQEGVNVDEIEIVVVDDGSTDATPDVLAKYGNRVRCLRKDNGGQGSAFNVGIRACRGNLIALLDGDDWWHRRKLSMVVDAFERDRELVAVGHGIYEVDQLAGRTYEVKPDRALDLHLRTREKAGELIRSMAYLGTSRLTARRDVLLSLLDVPEDLIFEADEYLFTLLPACGRVAVLPDCLTYYRIHGGNLYQGSRSAGPAAVPQAKLALKAGIFGCLTATLPRQLLLRGCTREIVDIVMAPAEVMATRLRLQAHGGRRWENFRSEARAAMLAKPRFTPMNTLILCATLLLTILVSPRHFFRLRSDYSGSTLRRLLRGAKPDNAVRH
jgi:hypothetical protein